MPTLTYSLQRLEAFAKEQNIKLIGEYTAVNRDTRIKGQCLKCPEPFDRPFRSLIQVGAYCEPCGRTIGRLKIAHQFDKTFLMNYCRDNEIEIYGEYDHVNRDTIISGKCKNCSGNFGKALRHLIQTGAHCISCSFSIRIMPHKYDKKYLEEYCKEHEIVLIGEYDKLCKTTVISGKCTTIKCDGIFNKQFEYVIDHGAYCPPCQENVKQHKFKESCLKSLGVDSPMKSPQVLELWRQNYKDKTGYDNPGQNPDVKKKMIETNMKIRNVPNPMQCKLVQKQTRETNMARYGKENVAQVSAFKLKKIETSMIKYRVPHPMQCPEIAEKSGKGAYKSYVYTLPSGKEITLQGYEYMGMDRLLKTWDEDEIVTSRKEVPHLTWIDSDGKNHRHFVDFYIPNKNMCIEIKSTWTLGKKITSVFLKQQFAKEQGFKYHIWVFDKNGERVSRYK